MEERKDWDDGDRIIYFMEDWNWNDRIYNMGEKE